MGSCLLISGIFAGSFTWIVKGWIKCVEIFGIQIFLNTAKSFSKALEVNDFPLPQELQHVVDVWIIADMQQVVVGGAGLLFWGDFVRTTLHNII